MDAGSLTAVLSLATLFLVVGIVCACVAIAHHSRSFSRISTPRALLADAATNPVREVRRLAGKHVQHIVESVTSGCFSFSATPLQAEAARAHGSHLNLVALPIASAVYLLAWLVENTLGVAASVGQGSALRAALAFRGAERGNCYLGCSALLNSWLAVMGFGLASPLVMVGLVGVYAGSFLPRWVSVTRYGTRLSAEGERDAAPVVPRGAVAPLAVNALDEVFAAEPEPAVTAPAPASPTVLATVPAERRQSIAWGAPEDGDGGGRRPGRRQSIAWGAPEDGDGGGRPGRQQSIAWGAQADAAPASPRRDGGRPLGRQPSAAWGAPLSSPLPSPSPSPSASASGAAALLTDSGPSSPALRPDGDAAGGTASSGRQLPRRLSQRRVSHSLVSWSTNIAAVAIVHRARAQVLKRAWSITGTRPRLQPDWALRELADHIEEWHLRPRAFHPLLAPVGFAYETHSRLLHYFAVAQLAGSPAEAGAALIVGFPLYLVGAACLVLAVPLAPVAAVAPLCLPFAEKEGTVLQHGNVWLSMLLLTWLSLGALAHGYARQPDEGYFLLLRWMVLFFWACISASTIGLSRRAGVDTRWYVCMQWLTGLCAASLLASHIAIEVDRAAGTAMAGALTLVALVINVASAAYIGVGVLYFLLSRQSNIGEMVPVASQVLAVEAGQTLAGRKLAVMRRETTLGPAGTIVELHGSSVRAPATGKSMDMTRFASSEHVSLDALPPHFPLLCFRRGDVITIYNEWNGWLFGRDSQGLFGWFPAILGGKRKKAVAGQSRLFRGRFGRRLRAMGRSLRWTFTLYRPKDIERHALENPGAPLPLRCKGLFAWTLLAATNTLCVAMIVVGFVVKKESTLRVVLVMVGTVVILCLIFLLILALDMFHHVKLIRSGEEEEAAATEAGHGGGRGVSVGEVGAAEALPRSVVLPEWDPVEEDPGELAANTTRREVEEEMFTEEAFPSFARDSFGLEESYTSLPGSVA